MDSQKYGIPPQLHPSFYTDVETLLNYIKRIPSNKNAFYPGAAYAHGQHGHILIIKNMFEVNNNIFEQAAKAIGYDKHEKITFISDVTGTGVYKIIFPFAAKYNPNKTRRNIKKSSSKSFLVSFLLFSLLLAVPFFLYKTVEKSTMTEPNFISGSSRSRSTGWLFKYFDLKYEDYCNPYTNLPDTLVNFVFSTPKYTYCTLSILTSGLTNFITSEPDVE